MAGVKIKVDTAAAQVETKKLASSLAALGQTTKLTEADVKKLEQRMLDKMGADTARKHIEALTKSVGLTKAEIKALEKEMGVAETGAVKLGKSFSSLGVQLGAFMSATAIYMLVNKVYTAAKDYETALTDMGKVTKRSFDLIKSDIAALGPQLGSSTALMKGYYQTISAGITEPAKAMEFLTVAAKAANAAHLEQEEVVRGLSKIMAGFTGSIKSASEAADLLFQMEQEGQTTVKELIPIIGEAAAISKMAGVSYNEMAAALANMTKISGSTAQAATQLKAIMISIVKPQEQMIELLKRMGYASTISMVKTLGFSGAIKKIAEEAEKSGKGLGKFFESGEALSAIGAMLADDFKGFNLSLAEMQNKTGKAENAFQAWAKTAQGAAFTFDNTMNDVMREFGQIILPLAVKQMTDFSNWVKENKSEITSFFKALSTAIDGVTWSLKSMKAFWDITPFAHMIKTYEILTAAMNKAKTAPATVSGIPGVVVPEPVKSKEQQEAERQAAFAKQQALRKQADAEKKLLEDRKSAEEKIVDIIRKNAVEIEQIGKGQEQKDRIKLQGEMKEYRRIGVEKGLIAKIFASESEKITLETKERESKIILDAFVADWAEMEKVAADYLKDMYKNSKEASKDLEEMYTEQADFAATENERAINKIIADHAKKIRKIKEIEGKIVNVTPEQTNILDKLKVRVDDEKNRALAEQAVSEAKNQADFYSKIIGYEDTYREKQLAWIEKVRLAEIAAGKDQTAANAKAKQSIRELDYQLFQEKTKQVSAGLADMEAAFSSISNMYAQGSEEQEKWAEAAKAMMVAQKALAVVNAVATIAAAGTAPWPLNFANIAAMVAAMAALLGSIGVGIGGAGNSTYKASTEYAATTVLGGAEGKSSESIDNVTKLLEDIHAKEYSELHMIYSEMQKLNANITGLVGSVLRNAGFGLKGMGVETGEFASPQRKWLEDTGIEGGYSPLGQAILSAIHSIGEYIFGGRITKEIVGGGVSLSPATISALLEGGSVAGQQFVSVKTTTSGWLFGKDKVSIDKQYEALGDEVTSFFTKVYVNLSKSMLAVAKIFGTDIQEVLNYIFPAVEIDVFGLDAEGIAKKLTAWMSETGDVMAQALFKDLIGKYQKAGEGFMETTIRVASELSVFTQWMDVLGMSVKGTIPELIALSQEVIDAVGGLDKLQEGLGAFYDFFFTESEKHIIQLDLINKQLSAVNMVLPETAAQFRDFFLSLDLEDPKQLAQFTFLIALMPQLLEYYDYANKLLADHMGLEIELLELLGDKSEALALSRKMELEAMDESLWSIQKVVWALTDAQDALNVARVNLEAAYEAEMKPLNESLEKTNELVSELKGYVEKLKSARESMRLEDAEFERNRYRNAQLVLAAVLGEARGGIFTGLKDIDNTLSVLSESNTDLYTNSTAYKRDFWRTYLSISELEDLAGTQLSAEEKIVANTQAQIDLLQAQLDAVLGVGVAVLSLAEATRQYQAALSGLAGAKDAARAALATPYSPPGGYAAPHETPTPTLPTPTPTPKETPSSIPNRVAGEYMWITEAQWIEAWTNAAKIDAYEYIGRYFGEIGGYAEGGSHSGGWRMVGERGPELEYTGPSQIYSNPKSKAMLDNTELVKEVRGLREDLKQSNVVLITNSKKMSKFIERWDGDGLPDTRTTT